MLGIKKRRERRARTVDLLIHMRARIVQINESQVEFHQHVNLCKIKNLICWHMADGTLIRNLMTKHKPKGTGEIYWWSPYEVQPRLDWIDKQIKRLKR